MVVRGYGLQLTCCSLLLGAKIININHQVS